MKLSTPQCYAALKSRDRRFDGIFYPAVRTTGIYCRPSCPAVTPKRHNVEFYRSAAAAQQAGFRACKRCLPDATPGSPEWDIRGDLVGRAMGLVGDGVVDREGVAGLAHRLGYSQRQLNRVMTDELGAGPNALARAERTQTARTLIETSTLSMAEIAFASGFGSIRQFNDTIRSVYDASPSQLRTRRRTPQAVDGSAIRVQLPTREPFDLGNLFAFLAARTVRGVEHGTGDSYARALDLPHGHGTVDVVAGPRGLWATFRLADWRDLAPAVRRVRRLFDLDADSAAIDDALAADPQLRPLVQARPGLRVAGSVSLPETLLRAIIGQQVSVAGARTVTGSLADTTAAPLQIAHPRLTRVFPTMASVLTATDNDFPMPAARRETIRRVARAVLKATVDLDADRADLREQLLAIRGIGPWTANYVVMRAARHPDVFLASDLGVKRAMSRLGITHPAAGWQPWRSYAMHHLWATEPDQSSTPSREATT
ncbi:MAG: AlkA N-terminal domain-containing protein [Beutenbergiaceae bacterium]